MSNVHTKTSKFSSDYILRIIIIYYQIVIRTLKS
nr:MAG TPA: hypothetical protein [Caudoviricetes sp.]